MVRQDSPTNLILQMDYWIISIKNTVFSLLPDSNMKFPRKFHKKNYIGSQQNKNSKTKPIAVTLITQHIRTMNYFSSKL